MANNEMSFSTESARALFVDCFLQDARKAILEGRLADALNAMAWASRAAAPAREAFEADAGLVRSAFEAVHHLASLVADGERPNVVRWPTRARVVQTGNVVNLEAWLRARLDVR